MKIAITGGEGFIGSRLRAKLEKDNHECVIIDLKSTPAVDILDLPTLTSAIAGCDTIYHLAAEHTDDVFPRSRYYDVNVQGTKNVLAAADANNIKHVIFTSSFAVYGLDAKYPDEEHPVAPFNDYGNSKLEAEMVLRKWADKRDDISLTIVRPVVVFGENNRGNVYNLIKQIDSGRFLMVGNGWNRKSIAYVENVAAFLKFCLSEGLGYHLYNYADIPNMTTRELVSTICKRLRKEEPKLKLPYSVGLAAGKFFDVIAQMTGRKFPISAVRIQKFCADTMSNTTKSRDKGFVPEYSIADGLARMIAHDFRPR